MIEYLEAIESQKCEFNGVPYKSKFEGLVAIFLYLMKADFEYEPRGFRQGWRKFYVPDFKVKNNNGYGAKTFWVEVKGAFNLVYEHWDGHKYQRDDERKVLDFAKSKPILIIDKLPQHSFENFEKMAEWFWVESRREAKNARLLHPWCSWWLHWDESAVVPLTDGERFYLSKIPNYLNKKNNLKKICEIFNATNAVYDALKKVDLKQYYLKAPELEIKEIYSFDKIMAEIEKEACFSKKPKEQLKNLTELKGLETICNFYKIRTEGKIAVEVENATN